ncbi:hypothetical protein EYF80_050826 [Liparis tanakae]|uniref:Uncharacterized protein n=1 Tax=Liparis tanakae TaxID=230148 RepID=A0A4Z2FF12_9TELE|nr:hypothetical protein EYF80_050826 [Liparis tanakae]
MKLILRRIGVHVEEDHRVSEVLPGARVQNQHGVVGRGAGEGLLLPVGSVPSVQHLAEAPPPKFGAHEGVRQDGQDLTATPAGGRTPSRRHSASDSEDLRRHRSSWSRCSHCRPERTQRSSRPGATAPPAGTAAAAATWKTRTESGAARSAASLIFLDLLYGFVAMLVRKVSDPPGLSKSCPQNLSTGFSRFSSSFFWS